MKDKSNYDENDDNFDDNEELSIVSLFDLEDLVSLSQDPRPFKSPNLEKERLKKNRN